MITEKQKTLSEQSVYGDLILTTRDKSVRYKINAYSSTTDTFWYDENGNVRWGYISNSKIPVLRPLTELTKEISHKGYNDDKPFIPLVELAKTQYKDFKVDAVEILDERSMMCKGYSKEISKRIMKENVKCNCAYWFHLLSSERCDEERDLLHQWHFDTRKLLEKSEAISTEIINPYEV